LFGLQGPDDDVVLDFDYDTGSARLAAADAESEVMRLTTSSYRPERVDRQKVAAAYSRSAHPVLPPASAVRSRYSDDPGYEDTLQPPLSPSEREAAERAAQTTQRGGRPIPAMSDAAT